MATRVITIRLLGRGAHASPRRGACLLELASVLAGERWSSRPQSVHPALADAADLVNDLMTDDHRRLLTPLAPLLPGTSATDGRAWPAVASVCVRAALHRVSGLDQLQLPTDLDITRHWLGEASSPSGRRPRAGRDHQWVRRTIRAALLLVAGPANMGDADAALCQVLLDCINECRRLSGRPAVDPRVPLADCPRRLAVQPRLMRSPGCDWMELGYEPVPSLQAAPARAAQTARAPRHPRLRGDSGKHVEWVSGARGGADRRE